MAPSRPPLRTTLLLVALVGVVAGVGLATAAAAPAGQPDAAPVDAVSAPASSGAPVASGAAPTAVQSDEFVERFEFRLLPSDPEWVEADVTYQVPGDVDELSVFEDDEDVRIVAADGFEDAGGDEWTWDGTTESPSATIRVRLTTDVRSRTWAGYGTEEWAIVQRPPLGVVTSGASASTRDVELAVDGEGVAGTDLVYLGAHETHETQTDDERVVLVVPDSVTLPDPPSEVVALLGHASDRLRFGHRPDGVYHGFVVPDDVESGLLGRNFGTDSLYFNRFQLDTADGVWVHEYVHARQNNEALTRETRWLSEASADYYEPLMVLEAGHVDFEAFRAELERGREPPFDEVVLSEPGTWQGQAVTYTHGATVVAAIDREIRAQTDGNATFQGVMAAWAEADTFDQEAFLDAVEAQGGPEARELARELTETTQLPETWDRQTHERLFDEATARDYSPASEGLSVRVTDDPTVSIAGPYRQGIAAGPLAVGESIAVRVEVSNGDNATRTAEPTLRIGDRTADSAAVTVEPGETRTVELVAALERPGTHVLAVAGYRSELTVHERVPVRIESVAVVDGGGGGRLVEAVVAGDGSGIALGEYEIRADGRTLDRGTVVLSPGDSRTLRASLPEDVEGTVTVIAGNATATADAEQSGDGLPGFGPVAALVALVATGCGLAVRSR